MRLRIRRINKRQQLDIAWLLAERIEYTLTCSWRVKDEIAAASWKSEAARAMAAYRAITRSNWYKDNPGRLVAMREALRAADGTTPPRWLSSSPRCARPFLASWRPCSATSTEARSPRYTSWSTADSRRCWPRMPSSVR